MLTEVLSTFASLLLILLGIYKFKARALKNYPPGPYQWPVIGNIRLLRTLTRKYRGQHRAFIELSRRYSSNLVSLRLGKLNVVAVSGYKEIQKILGSEEFDGRPWNEFIKLRNMGLKKGITMSDGAEWKQVRGWLVKAMRQVGFGRAEMSVQLNEELLYLLEKIKNGGTFRMKSLVAPTMINVIWRLATGKRIKDENKLNYFLQLMERRAKVFDMSGGILSVFPWLRHVAPEASGYNVLVALNNEMKNFLMEAIEDHKKSQITGRTSSDLIDMFYEEMKSGKRENKIFNDEQLFMILLDLLIAGSVTTTSTLDFLFFHMTIHQEIQSRLQEELDLVIGKKRLPEINDRPRLPFTEAVITESQRSQIILPIIGPRRVIRATNVEGYEIPKETCILLNVSSIYMNAEYFPNPKSFDPERFFKNGSFVPDEKLLFFGRGHRRCPGEADAKAAVFLFFVGIMQRFKLLPKPGAEAFDVEPNFGITASPKPYEILLVPRDGF